MSKKTSRNVSTRAEVVSIKKKFENHYYYQKESTYV